jgi:hypothetical protein
MKLSFVCLLVSFCCVVPVNADSICTGEVRRASLVATYNTSDTYLAIRTPGLGNNPGECLTQPFTCELFLCEVEEGSPVQCKDNAPLGHCYDVTITQCIVDLIRQLPYISYAEFVSVGSCP